MVDPLLTYPCVEGDESLDAHEDREGRYRYEAAVKWRGKWWVLRSRT